MFQKMRTSYQHTIYASFVGYVVQAIVNNFVPLLFVTLGQQYGISMEQIALIISVNFAVQLLVDLISPALIQVIGYKRGIILAHFCASVGLVLFRILPDVMPHPFTGFLCAVVIYACGGGLLEVLVSPIVEACPTKNKAGVMGLLHSFYCWGHAGVVILSTLFFVTVGIEYWKTLICLWALVPLVNMFYFYVVPVPELKGEGHGGSVKGLFSTPIFWVFLLLMFCSGASELSISQWVSAFAETGLQVSKTLGDLLGTLSFALLMGIGRVVYAKMSERISIQKYMMASGVLCVVAYLLTALSPNPMWSLVDCGIAGFSVGVLWPGTFSLAAERMTGSTAMFAFLALAGDCGCSLGPTLVGTVAQNAGGSLHKGILAALLFPILLLVALALLQVAKKSQRVDA